MVEPAQEEVKAGLPKSDRAIPLFDFSFPEKGFIPLISEEQESKLQTFRYPAYHHEGANGRLPKACIVIFHGFGNHVGTFAFVAKRFSDQGYEVAGFDLKGFGESYGLRGILNSPKQLAADALNFVAKLQDFLKATYPGGENIKIVAFGNSLGAAVAINAQRAYHVKAEGQALFDSLLLQVPVVGQAGNPPESHMKQLEENAKKNPFGVAQQMGMPLTEYLQDYNSLPFHYTGNILHLTQLTQIRLTNMNKGYFPKLTVPVHASVGTQDKNVTEERIKQVFQNMGSERKEHVVYEGGHLLLFDAKVSEDVTKAQIAFLDSIYVSAPVAQD